MISFDSRRTTTYQRYSQNGQELQIRDAEMQIISKHVHILSICIHDCKTIMEKQNQYYIMS